VGFERVCRRKIRFRSAFMRAHQPKTVELMSRVYLIHR
jgi:hypothetical protein